MVYLERNQFISMNAHRPMIMPNLSSNQIILVISMQVNWSSNVNNNSLPGNFLANLTTLVMTGTILYTNDVHMEAACSPDLTTFTEFWVFCKKYIVFRISYEEAHEFLLLISLSGCYLIFRIYFYRLLYSQRKKRT